MYICLKCTHFLNINAGNFLSDFVFTTPQSPAAWKIKMVDCSIKTHPTFRCQTKCGEAHSTYELGPAGNTLQIESFYSTPWYFELLSMSCDHGSGYRTLIETDGSSLNKQLFEYKLILYNIHTQSSNMTSMKQWQQTLIRAKLATKHT